MAALGFGGCATAIPDTPAVLVSADAQTLEEIATAIGASLGRGPVRFGAGDPTRTPSIAVLPPPVSGLEDRSLARPSMYDLVLRGGACVAIARDGANAVRLGRVRCSPVR